jgi:hypothetical protein
MIPPEKSLNGRGVASSNGVAPHKSVSTIHYDYHDEQNQVVFQVVRQVPGRDGQKKSIFQRRPDGNGGWVNNLKGVRLVPYRLPEILKQDPGRTIFVVEGEKCADALWAIDVAATTNPQGAGKWKDAFSEYLRGRHVVILPDKDEAGREHAEKVEQSLTGIAASVLVVELPNLPHKGDVADWLAAGGDSTQLLELVKAKVDETRGTEPTADKADEDGGAEDSKKQRSVATRLVEMAVAAGVKLLHTPDGVAFAVVPMADHSEVIKLRSNYFSSWLKRSHYRATSGKTAGAQAVADAVGTLEGIALHDCPVETVHLRVAEKDGRLYIDLADPLWRVVEVDAAGWRIVNNAPVRFRRHKGMVSLPEPMRGGSIEQLRPFLNVASDEDWRLSVAWLLAALRPTGPYPLMVLSGQQGSAKSTTARVLRRLIDPNTAPIRCEPKDARDLMIAANASWGIVYDNLSSVPVWLSDALCRLATGGGFATRALWTDDEEMIFDAQRPVILTSIEDVTTRGDLLERSLILSLPPIPEHQRRPEKELWNKFDAECPYIFGALLDALSGALRELPGVKLSRMPRMADFAVWATACEQALRWPAGSFLLAYDKNRADANAISLDCSPLFLPLQQLLSDTPEWSGTAAELLDKLAAIAGEQVTRGREWPRRANALSGKLKRLVPNLAAVGIVVVFHRDMKRRTISIRQKKVRETSSSSSCTSCQGENKAFSHDDPHGDLCPHDDPMTIPQSEKPLENKPHDAHDDHDAKSRSFSYLAPGCRPEDAETPFDEEGNR